MPPSLRDALLVAFAFFVLHLFLLLGTFDVYDLEETEYGNVAVALLDGHLGDYSGLRTDPSLGEAPSSGAGRRRRTVWSIEPLVTPFFALLGPSMLSLKLFALSGGALWAALWFLLARRLAPSVPPWAAGLLFVLPVPLVQRAALSATSITAHLGSSLWHVASLLAVVYAIERRSRPALFFLGGLLAGWGLHCSLSLAPLLVGVVVLLVAERQRLGAALWGLGMLPGLSIAWLFADPSRAREGSDLVVAATGLSAGSASRSEGLPGADFLLALTHGPGFGRVDPTSLSLEYLPLGAVYSGVFVSACLWGWSRRSVRSLPRSDERLLLGSRALPLALMGSFSAFLFAWALTGFRLDPTYFDGLRYLLPLTPLPPLLLLWLWNGKTLSGQVVLGIGLLHLAGFAMLFRPAVFPAPWQQLKGYEPWVMKAWLGVDLDESTIAEDRRGRWGLWAGLSDAQRSSGLEVVDWDATAGHHQLSGAAADEYWRGVGVGLTTGEAGRFFAASDLPAGLPGPAGLVWQGAGMARCYVGPEVVERLLSGVPAVHLGDLWYGFARADIYCGGLATMFPRWPAQLSERIEQGQRDSWALDYAATGGAWGDDRPQGFIVY